MNKKIQENINILRQGRDLIKNMQDSVYQRSSATIFNSNIGSHVRHNLDHYTSFLAGLECGNINYDNRQRDLLIETDRNAAISLIDKICSRLEGLQKPTKTLQLWISRDGSSKGEWINTSIARELEFLMSHTIHHYAIITIMCRLEGLSVEKNFGVAPSTLRYWDESNSQCAH